MSCVPFRPFIGVFPVAIRHSTSRRVLTRDLLPGLDEECDPGAGGFCDVFGHTSSGGVIFIGRVLQARDVVGGEGLHHVVEVPGHVAASVVCGHVAFGVVSERGGSW